MPQGQNIQSFTVNIGASVALIVSVPLFLSLFVIVFSYSCIPLYISAYLHEYKGAQNIPRITPTQMDRTKPARHEAKQDTTKHDLLYILIQGWF